MLLVPGIHQLMADGMRPPDPVCVTVRVSTWPLPVAGRHRAQAEAWQRDDVVKREELR
ncbi:hypothetical protein ACFXPZ_43250 [Streptomyces sp. NPDC059101]|uniref:hypothetical protein n=1 Tax=unclassified Streptomyces TaxID=2593676 RepID=UPI0036794B53